MSKVYAISHCEECHKDAFQTFETMPVESEMICPHCKVKGRMEFIQAEKKITYDQAIELLDSGCTGIRWTNYRYIAIKDSLGCYLVQDKYNKTCEGLRIHHESGLFLIEESE